MKPLVAGAGVALGFWALPLFEEIGHRPGNLSALVGFFAAPRAEGVDLAGAVSVAATQLVAPLLAGFRAPVGAELLTHRVGPLPLILAAGLVGASGAATFVAWRQGHRFVAALGFIALGAIAAAGASVGVVTGAILDHLVFWIAIPGTVCLFVIAAGIANHLPDRWSDPGTGTAVFAALLVATAAVAATGVIRDHRGAAANSIVYQLTNDVAQYAARNQLGRVNWEFSQEVPREGLGVVLQAWKQDLSMSVSPPLIAMTAPRFQPTGREGARLRLTTCESTAPDDAGVVVARRQHLCIVRQP